MVEGVFSFGVIKTYYVTEVMILSRKKTLASLVTLVVVIIYLVSPANPLLQKVFASQQSTIGGVEVEGVSSSELKEVLNEAIMKWTSEPVIVIGGGSSLQLNTTALEYDVDSTIVTYESMTKKAWYEFWKSKRAVQLPLEIAPSDTIKNEIANVETWHTDSTYEKVMMQAAYLRSHEVEADATNLASLESDRITLEIEKIPASAMGINELVPIINDQIINPNENFSLIEALGKQLDLANREALNFMASMLYSVALKTNSEILERSSQNVVPPYLQPGMEAAIERDGSKDLRFMNTTANALKVKVTIEGDNLKVEVYTTVKEQEVSVRVSRDQEVAPRIITRFSNDLAIGKKQLLQDGSAGLRVSVYRTASNTGIEKLVSKDYYAPIHRIIVKSSLQPVTIVSAEEASATPESPVLDLDGDGLPDYEDGTISEQGSESSNSDTLTDLPLDGSQLPAGSYYDKGGNLITP